jgi:hypothetical protein
MAFLPPVASLAPLPRVRIPTHVTGELLEELTDPVNFIVGALIIVRHEGLTLLTYVRLVAALWVAAAVASPVVAGAFWPKLELGDPVPYGLMLLGAGAITLIPGRVDDLHRDGRYGTGYPIKLRRRLAIVEMVVAAAAAIFILAWQFGGPGHHTTLRAVIWAAGAVSISDLITMTACANVVFWRNLLVAAEGLLQFWPFKPAPGTTPTAS